MLSAGSIILINGYPGVGKLTVAKELSRLLPNSRVLDSHVMEDSASSLFDRDREPEAFNALRQGMRDAIFRSIHLSSKSNAEPRPIYILTESMPSSPAGLSTLRGYLNVASASSFPLIHVVLSCSTGENIRRLACPARVAKSKLTDEGALMELRMEEEIAKFYGGVKRERIGGLAGEYEIDTENMDARSAAGIIAEYTLDALRQQGWMLQFNRERPARKS